VILTGSGKAAGRERVLAISQSVEGEPARAFFRASRSIRRRGAARGEREQDRDAVARPGFDCARDGAADAATALATIANINPAHLLAAVHGDLSRRLTRGRR